MIVYRWNNPDIVNLLCNCYMYICFKKNPNFSVISAETVSLQNIHIEPDGPAIPQSNSNLPDAPPPSYDEVVKNTNNDISKC